MNMLKLGRSTVWMAIVLMSAAFLFPLWRIDLWAPQYPEGLKMWIGIHHITGDLTNINILNHYIGMKKIIPGSIPELQYMPIVLVGLMIIGGIAALIDKRWAILSWLIVFLGIGGAGLYDFHAWNEDFGHNLSPDAPIKVPGMIYDPPIFAHKSLLNMIVHSYPGWGGIAMFGAFFLGIVGVFLCGRKTKIDLKHIVGTAALIILPFLTTGCNAKPEAMIIGVDTCETCRMTITDPKYGAEIITEKGKIYKFDSFHCMLHYYAINKGIIKSIWVEDFLRPGTLINAETALYLKPSDLESPMGKAVIAAETSDEIKSIQSQVKTTGGQSGWNDIVASSP